MTLDTAALGRPGSVGTFGWGGAATTTFSVNPAEDMAIVIMGQVMPNDGDLLQRVETLVYQALIDAPRLRVNRVADAARPITAFRYIG